MILYALSCARGHEFEAWFKGSAEYDAQAGRGLIECPVCGSAKVTKAIMAPAVAGTKSEKAPVMSAAPASVPAEIEAMVKKVRAHVEANFDYVGDKFPEEARAIHYGEKDARGIYGEASADEVKALTEEGIEIAPLPGTRKPRARLN